MPQSKRRCHGHVTTVVATAQDDILREVQACASGLVHVRGDVDQEAAQHCLGAGAVHARLLLQSDSVT